MESSNKSLLAELNDNNIRGINNESIASGTLSFKIFDNIKKLYLIRDFWICKQWQHYTDYDYYIDIVSNEKGVIRPCVIAAYENGNPILLLIGVIREKDYRLKIGYKPLWKIKTRYLEIMYGGVLGEQSLSVCKGTIKFVKKILSNEKLDYVLFKELDINSPLNKAIKKFGGKLSTSKFDISNPHLYMDFPDSFKTFLETKTGKKRRKIKSIGNRLEEDFKGRFELNLYSELKDIDTIMNDIDAVASNTYQDKLGVAFVNDSETEETIKYELNRNRLLAWILYIDGKPIAYATGLIYRNAFLGSKMGFLYEYNYYRPGSYLMLQQIIYLCESNIVNRLDFGFGDTEWKRDYNTSTQIESNVYIYSMNPKGFVLNLMGTFNRITLLLYRNLSKRFESIRKIKKKSRDTLRKS